MIRRGVHPRGPILDSTRRPSPPDLGLETSFQPSFSTCCKNAPTGRLPQCTAAGSAPAARTPSLTCPAHSCRPSGSHASASANREGDRRPPQPPPPSPALTLPAAVPPRPHPKTVLAQRQEQRLPGLGRVLGLTSVASEERSTPHFMLEELLQHESNGQSPSAAMRIVPIYSQPTAEAPLL